VASVAGSASLDCRGQVVVLACFEIRPGVLLPSTTVEIDRQKITLARWKKRVNANDMVSKQVVEKYLTTHCDKFTISAVGALGPGFLACAIDPFISTGWTIPGATFSVSPHFREYVWPSAEKRTEYLNINV
jgi:hypothetical protein